MNECCQEMSSLICAMRELYIRFWVICSVGFLELLTRLVVFENVASVKCVNGEKMKRR